jgi:hypothetical protein
MGILPLPQLSEEKPGEKIALDERCVGVGGTSIKGILCTLYANEILARKSKAPGFHHR